MPWWGWLGIIALISLLGSIATGKAIQMGLGPDEVPLELKLRCMSVSDNKITQSPRSKDP